MMKRVREGYEIHVRGVTMIYTFIYVDRIVQCAVKGNRGPTRLPTFDPRNYEVRNQVPDIVTVEV